MPDLPPSPPRVGSGYGLAKDTVCVDFDGTIIEWADLDDLNPVLQAGVVEALRTLKDAGKRILIFTSRLSYDWLRYEGRSEHDQYHHVRDILVRHDIPFDDIIGEKVPAEAYIDDMAVGFRGDWAAVLTELGMTSPAPGPSTEGLRAYQDVLDWASTHYSDGRVNLGSLRTFLGRRMAGGR